MLLAIEGTFSTFASANSYVVMETFNARIADKTMPGTFMNVFNAIGNLANQWHRPFTMYAVDMMPYWILVLLGLIYSITFVTVTKKWLFEK